MRILKQNNHNGFEIALEADSNRFYISVFENDKNVALFASADESEAVKIYNENLGFILAGEF